MTYLTTYFKTKTALIDLLAADATFNDVTLAYGQVLTDRDSAFETIYLGDASGTREPNALRPARTSLKEEYDFDLHIECWLENVDSQQEADARCYALADRIAVIVGERNDLGTDFISDLQVRRWDYTGGPWDRGYASGLRLGINVRARLT